jgi:hypothetical protein
MTLLHLVQNAETIDRLVIQGGVLLKNFHAGYEKNPVGTRPSFCVASLRTGAILCTRCTTVAPKKSLTALSSRHACPFPTTKVEALGSLVCAARISGCRTKNRRLRNRDDFSAPRKPLARDRSTPMAIGAAVEVTGEWNGRGWAFCRTEVLSSVQ